MDGSIVLRFDPKKRSSGIDMRDNARWSEKVTQLKNEEISQEEYDHWRYNFPDDTSYRKRVLSNELDERLQSETINDFLNLFKKKK